MKKYKILFFIFFSFGLSSIQAQTLLNTLGVENGNLNSWNCYSGNCCPINTTTFGVVNGKHTIMNGNGLDAYGNFPIVNQQGGNFSLRIGNDSSGNLASSANFTFTVDSNNYFLALAYAAVVQLKGHANNIASRFYFRVKDNLGNDIFNSAQCANCNANPYPSGLQTSAVDTSVKFLPWTQQYVNLKHFIHQQVTIEVVAGNDSIGNAFGYGYFDLISSGYLFVNESYCVGNNYVTLHAPQQFQNYQWYDTSNTLLANNSSLTLTQPNLSLLIGNVYYVVCYPANGSGIQDTIFYSVKLIPHQAPHGGFLNSLLCDNISVAFSDTAVLHNDPIASVLWNFGDVNSGANNQSILVNTNHHFSNSGNFTITQTQTSIYGCVGNFQQQIFVQQSPIANAGNDTSACPLQNILLGGVSVAVGGSGFYTYQWNSSGIINNTHAAHSFGLFITNSFAELTVTDSITQCYSSDTVNITVLQNCVNHPPVANDDTAYIAFGQTKLINVLKNDADNDGAVQPQGNLTTAIVTLVPATYSGSVSVVNNQIQYSPLYDSVLNDTIYYVVCDNGYPVNYCDTAMLVVHCYKTQHLSVPVSVVKCYGMNLQLNNSTLIGGSGNVQINWNPNTALSCTNCLHPFFQNFSSTSFQIIVKDLWTLQADTATIFVKVDSPKVTLGADVSTTFNTPSIQLNAQNLGSSAISTYAWNPSPTGCPNCSNPTYAPSNPTDVIVIVTDVNSCTATDTIKIYACSTDCVWPGDANKDTAVNNFDVFNLGLNYGHVGPTRLIQSIVWNGYPATNWTNSVGSPNAKHADCNGDGVINDADTSAIQLNYNLRNTFNPTLTGVLPIYVTLPHTILHDSDKVYCGIGLGTASQPADSIYGVAFTFHYDKQVVDTNTINVQINSPSWLVNSNTDFLQTVKFYPTSTGAIDIGLVRKSHDGKSGYGNLVTISIDVVTGNVIGRLSSLLKDYLMRCYLTDVKIIDYKGRPITARAIADTATIEYKPTGINGLSGVKNKISIQPNPVKDYLKVVKSGEVKITDIEIENVLGQIIIPADKIKLNDNADSYQINVTEMPNGIYFIAISFANGEKVMKKFVVEH